MQPEDQVCVTGGYPMRARGVGYEAEAIVYIWGGRTVARFIAGGSLGQTAARRTVERRARAWITADDARWWSEWWRRDAA